MPTAMTVSRIISESVMTSVKPRRLRAIPLRCCEWRGSPGIRPIHLRVMG